MRIALGILLVTVGFIGGVTYDQNTVVMPLQRELRTERQRNEILMDALRHAIPNKFRMSDSLYEAMKRRQRADP